MYSTTSNRTREFCARLVVGWSLLLTTTVCAQDWDNVLYNSREVGINNACVVNDTTYALFGDQGTITLLNTRNLVTTTVRGDRKLVDLRCGTMLTNDTMLVFDGNGFSWVTNMIGKPYVSFNVPGSRTVNGCHFSKSSILVVAADNGLLVRTGDFKFHNWPEIVGSTIFEDSSGAIMVGTTNGELLRFKPETLGWDTLCRASSAILRITASSSKVWFVTRQRLYSSLRSTNLQTWSDSVFTEPYARDLACIDDTLIMSTTYGPILRQQLSVDGKTWIGGEVGYKGYVPHGMLVGPAGILFYGERGFYRHAKRGALYQSAYYASNGLGLGRSAGMTYTFRSICRMSESKWFATTMSPNTVLQSIDSGRTWQPIVGGENEITDYPQVTIDGQSLYYLADSVRSIPDGQSWKTVKQWVLFKQTAGGNWTSVSADTISQEAEGMVAVPSGPIFIYGRGGVYRVSHDLSTVDTMDVASPRAVSFMSRNSSGVLASIGVSLGLSKDGGDSWSNYSVPSFGQLVHLYDDGRVLVISVKRSGTLYRLVSLVSEPPYSDWKEVEMVSEQNQPLRPSNIAHLDGFGTVVVSEGGYVAYSTDRGNSWTWEQPVPNSLFDLNALDLRDPKVVRVAGTASVILEKNFLLSGVSERNEGIDAGVCTATWRADAIHIPFELADDTRAELYSVSGQLILSSTAQPQKGSAVFPIGKSLPQGVYFVVLRSSTSASLCRVVVP